MTNQIVDTVVEVIKHLPGKHDQSQHGSKKNQAAGTFATAKGKKQFVAETDKKERGQLYTDPAQAHPYKDVEAMLGAGHLNFVGQEEKKFDEHYGRLASMVSPKLKKTIDSLRDAHYNMMQKYSAFYKGQFAKRNKPSSEELSKLEKESDDAKSNYYKTKKLTREKIKASR